MAKLEKIRNNQDYSITLESQDGDSVIILPHAVVPVDPKFLWKFPDRLMTRLNVKSTEVFSKRAEPKQEYKSFSNKSKD